MTKPTEHACDSKRIDDYLNERLSASQQAEFEAHLSGCESCQTEIQQQAAEPELWGHAVALLGQATSAAFDEASDDSGSGFRSRQVQSVLESLAPTDDPEMLGRIDDYEIIGVVGVGGMGAVLKGFDKSLRRVVAIKIMAPHLAGSGSARSRYQREARAAAAITHHNVIDIYGVSEANGLPYLVMPYARGPSLQKRIDEGGPLSVAEVLRIGRQIAAGLTAAHEQGLVHRDIKPANILLNDGIERLLITDFGVALAMDDASMTRTGVIAGTPQYMSPEQARGESVDYRSDLFSLGSILYTACTGRPPFRSEAAYGILRRITDDDPRPIREINPDIPEWLCRIVNRLMAKHPADQFQNAAEVTELLEGCLAHLQQPTHVALPQSVASSSSVETASLQVDERTTAEPSPTRTFPFSRSGVWIMVSSILLAALGLVTFQMTAPADIAGRWQGEAWTAVSLSSVKEAADWYTGSFTNAAGQQGAVQLEWSRLQRRYNGRWKSGDGQSGSITLRAGEAGSVCGAVSIDPDANVPSDMPRLRDFSWTRSVASTADVNQKSLAQKAPAGNAARPQIIESPIKGRIGRWGEGVFENARVKKGDLIVEIQDADPVLHRRLEDQLTAAKQQVTASEALLAASERNADSARQIVEAHKARVQSYETAKQQIAAAAKAAVASASSRVAAAEQEVVLHQAAFTQLKAEYERVKANHEQAITSEQELQRAERSFKEAEAKVAQAKSNIEAIRNDLEEEQNEGKAKESQAQADIDYATTLLLKAESDVAQADSEVAKAQADLTKAKKAVVEIQTKAARQESQLILAPFDGYITGLTESQIVKEGDQICRLIPEGATVVSPKKQPQRPRPAPQQTPSTPPPATSSTAPQRVITDQSLTNMFGTVSDLTRRLRESRHKIKVAEQTIEQHRASLSEVAKELSEIEQQILKTKKQTESSDAAEVAKAQEHLERLQVQLTASQGFEAFSKGSEAAAIQSLKKWNQQLADVEAEREIIIKLLESQLDAANSQFQYQKELRDTKVELFEDGRGVGFEDVVKTAHSLREAEAKMEQLRLLRHMYRNLGHEQPAATQQDPEGPKPD